MITISPTSLAKMESCKLHWKAVYVDKISDTGTKATFAGDAEHKNLEEAIKSGKKASDPFAAEVIDSLTSLGGKLEAEKWLSIDREYKFAPYGVPAYVRCKADAIATYKDGRALYIVDWKTGKWAPKDDSQVDYTQMRINALAAFGVKPKAEKATVALVYTQKKKIFPIVIRRSDIEKPTPEFQDLFVRFQKYEQAQGATHFDATPGRMCDFCPVATCQHHPGYEG